MLGGANSFFGSGDTEPPEFTMTQQTSFTGSATNRFGRSIQINDDYIFIVEGANAVIHVYDRTTRASITTISTASSYIYMISIDDQYIYVSDYTYNGNSGRVLAYRMSDFGYDHTIPSPWPSSAYYFGVEISTNGSKVVIGILGVTSGNYRNGGYALWDVASRSFDMSTLGSTSTYSLGRATAINDTHFLVGAYYNASSFRGAVYEYSISPVANTYTQYGAGGYYYLGTGTALDNDYFLVGGSGNANRGMWFLRDATTHSLIDSGGGGSSQKLGYEVALSERYYVIGGHDSYTSGRVFVKSKETLSTVGSFTSPLGSKKNFAGLNSIYIHEGSSDVLLLVGASTAGIVYAWT